MSMLGLNGPRHLKIAPLIAHIRTSLELIGKSLMIHAFLNSINDRNDVIDIFFKFFSFKWYKEYTKQYNSLCIKLY